MASLRRRGLSAVRPEMRARRGAAGGGRSDREVANLTPYSDSHSAWHFLKSSPPGPSPPGPMNHGSTTKSRLADGHLRSCLVHGLLVFHEYMFDCSV